MNNSNILNTIDYLPFGVELYERGFTRDDYRYTFSGKESDSEVKGAGNSIDFGARMYDPRLGRWLSIDPMVKRYPYVTPYGYALNMPIIAIDREGEDIGIVVTSMANSPGAGGKGHMAIVVGNDDIGYWIFSVELKGGNDYVKKDEVIFESPVQKIQAKISGKDEIQFYGHQEKTMEDLMGYMAKNAPGVNNTLEKEGFGYDRMAVLNETTPEQDKAFLEYLQGLTTDDYKQYEAISGNCCSITMDKINDFVGDVIKDNTFIDFPNNEFDKIIKDENWTVVMDNKATNDAKRKDNKKKLKQIKKQNKGGTTGKSKNPRFL